eukprot:2697547-Ditylum_brightwellii.AAC.1
MVIIKVKKFHLRAGPTTHATIHIISMLTMMTVIISKQQIIIMILHKWRWLMQYHYLIIFPYLVVPQKFLVAVRHPLYKMREV